MHTQSIIRLLKPDTKHAITRYVIVDCAATAGFEDYDEILTQLKQPDIEKHTLLTGENAWAIDHIAPYLLPILREQEAPAFFAPINRFVTESEKGRPAVFDRPQGELNEKIAPSAKVFAKHKRLAKQWQTRRIDQHAAAYANLGFKVTAEAAVNDDGRLIAATDAAIGQKRFFYEDGRLVRQMDNNKLSFIKPSRRHSPEFPCLFGRRFWGCLKIQKQKEDRINGFGCLYFDRGSGGREYRCPA